MGWTSALVAVIAAMFGGFSATSDVMPPATGGTPELITAAAVPSLHAWVVGQYRDCSGASPLPFNGAYLDTCMSGQRYVVGHDVSWIFRPLHGLAVGEVVMDRWAGYGLPGYTHTSVMRVVGIRDWWPTSRGVPPLQGGATTQLQTCEDGTNQYDEIVDLQLLYIQ